MDGTDLEMARCAEHPDRPSAGTCARCGSFMCADCRAEAVADHCADCASRLEQGRFVSQVPALAITMIVHGVLVGGMGAYFVVYGLFFAHTVATAPGAPASELDGIMSGIALGALSGIGVANLIPGALQIWAGIRLRTFRSRRLGLFALGAGLLTVLGCYCTPTSVALLIWGAVVLMHQDVVARFAATRPSGR